VPAFELLGDIRALRPEGGGNVPVVAITVLSRMADRGRITAAGFAARLDKPFCPDELLGTIKAIL
jgi:CheY-like chemotaxis protein